MLLSPLEAINRVNESVTVEMVVRRAKACPGCLDVFLDSEEKYRDPKNLGVAITDAGKAKFKDAGIDNPAVHFAGKTVQVRGVVKLKEGRPQIDVDDPKQIEIVD